MSKINQYLSLEQFESFIFGNETVEVSAEVLERVSQSFDFLKEFSANKIIYGVTTGFGPMAQYRIEDKDRVQLQYNLIRSHSSGTGKILSPVFVKSAILARLNTLALGNSGVHPSVIHLMQELLNRDITPLIFEHGGVGASGDLVQLAHLALVLIGEGEVFYKGERKATSEVFAAEGLQPIHVEIREGLALMNGTSVMTGIGVVNLANAKKLLDWSLKFSAAINEMVRAYDDHLSQELNGAKLHKAQQEVANRMREHLEGSQLIRKREDHLYKGENNEIVFKEKVQEYYSLRCVPQILGPVLTTIENAAEVLENEINSANDNPIIDVKNRQVYHGGNFHGDYISLEMDKLRLVVTKLSMLAERQLNYLMNAKINELLPPFVNLGKLGFNFGLQGVQFTAVSTTAENQMLSNSMYVHSIPNNNDNQDIVSMGTNAALLTAKTVENAYEVLAIEAMAIVQGIDALGYKDKVSPATAKLYNDIKAIFPVMSDDRPLYPYVQDIKEYLMK